MIEELQANFEAEQAQYQQEIQATNEQLEQLHQQEASLHEQLQALSQQLSELYAVLEQTETRYYTAAAVYIETLPDALWQELAIQRSHIIDALQVQITHQAELEQTYVQELVTYQHICQDLEAFELTESSATMLRNQKRLLEQQLAPYFAAQSAPEVSLNVYTWHSSRLELDIYVLPVHPSDPQSQFLLAAWQQVQATFELEAFVWNDYQAYRVLPAGEMAQVELFELLNQQNNIRWQIVHIKNDLTSTTYADTPEPANQINSQIDINDIEPSYSPINLDDPSYQGWYDDADIGRWKRSIEKLSEKSERILRSKEARRIRTLVMRMLAHGFIGEHTLPAEALWIYAPQEFQAEFKSHVAWLQKHRFLVPCTQFPTTHVSLNNTKLDDFRAVIAYDLPGVWEDFAHVE